MCDARQRRRSEAAEVERQWEQGTGVFRRELGPVRRSERAEARRAQREREEEQGRVHRLIERERVYQRYGD